jgi:hypothetical protein
MLEVQKYLQNHTLDKLKKEFGICVKKFTVTNENDIIILNYDQVASSKQKEHPIVRECRQLILENNTWKVIAKSFSRFYNYNETITNNEIFNNAKKHIFQTKHDGSIILLFWYHGWRIATRSTLGQSNVLSFADYTEKHNWITLFEHILGYKLENIDESLDKSYSYIFELCSPYNTVIRTYKKATLYLLASNSNVYFTEMDESMLNNVSKVLGVQRPETHNITLENMYKYLNNISALDPTFEGIVGKAEIRNGEYIRMKFKTESYLRLHHALSVPSDEMACLDIIKVILNGEIDEVLSNHSFMKHKNKIENIRKFIDEEYMDTMNYWLSVKDIQQQKDFAKTVCDYKYSSTIFKIKASNEFDKNWRSDANAKLIEKCYKSK